MPLRLRHSMISQLWRDRVWHGTSRLWPRQRCRRLICRERPRSLGPTVPFSLRQTASWQKHSPLRHLSPGSGQASAAHSKDSDKPRRGGQPRTSWNYCTATTEIRIVIKTPLRSNSFQHMINTRFTPEAPTKKSRASNSFYKRIGIWSFLCANDVHHAGQEVTWRIESG